MKKLAAILIVPALLLGACKKKAPEESPAPAAAAPAPVAAAPAPAPAPAAETSEANEELAAKKAKLDYGIMEDGYLNDAKGQWASSAKASTTYKGVKITNATGKPDSETWTNDNQEQGMDWIEFGFDKPVAATETRLAVDNGNGVEALIRLELQDTDGKWHTAWDGISDVKPDHRGRRTWFVKSFPKTDYKVKAIKYTIANNLFHGYKEIDAAQLIGE
jgi:hypothetical protein